MNLILSIAFLILALPLFTFIFILLYATGYPNPLYKQVRIGRGGKKFVIYKFRSMIPNDGLKLSQENDPRFTGVGKILRLLDIDELPQCLNIARGQMLLIGPRPEVPSLYMGYSTAAKKRYESVRPGLLSISAIQAKMFNDFLPTDTQQISNADIHRSLSLKSDLISHDTFEVSFQLALALCRYALWKCKILYA